jgi:hypothetical protein
MSHFSLFQMKIMRTVLYRVGRLPYLFLNIEPCGKGHSGFLSLTLCRDFALGIRRRKQKSLVCENEVFFHPHLGCGGVWLSRWLPAFHRNVLYWSSCCLQLCEDEDSSSLKHSPRISLNIRKYVTPCVILEEMELMDEAYDGSWMKYLHRT